MSNSLWAIVLAVAILAWGKALAQSDSIPVTAATLPKDGMVGWVSPDARRSTWDIIWSCLSIFLACSWKCVHLNVPTPAEARGEWHHVRIFKKRVPFFPGSRLFDKWRRRLVWMLIISIAPEVGVALAVKQWRNARRTLKETTGRDKDSRLTMAHAFLTNMGGVVMRYIIIPHPHKTQSEKAEQPDVTKGRPEADLTVEPSITAFKSATGSQHDPEATTDEGDLLSQPIDFVWHLKGDGDSTSPTTDQDGSDIIGWRITNELTEEDIKGQSRSDAFTKLFAVVQSTWLVVQSIARAYRGLAITQLELATIAFIFCAILMYGFWWHQPFGIEQRHTVVRVHQVPPVVRYYDADCHLDERVPDIDEFFDLVFFNVLLIDAEDIHKDMVPTVALSLSGTAFAAIHLAAWNWEFPSPLIQSLWRSFAVTALVTSFLPFVQHVLFSAVDSLSDGVALLLFWIPAFIMSLSYIVARLGILVLTFYSFTSMPASAYKKVEWTGATPKRLNTYLIDCIEIYDNQELRDQTLFAAFRTDFIDWTEAHFKTLDKTLRTNLKYFLKDHSIYINNEGIISQQLFILAQGKKAPEWPEEEVELYSEERGMKFQSKQNPHFSGLSANPMYTDEDKFGGERYDILDSKVKIFGAYYQIIGIPQ
ncbi:hypothetical protein B0T24DRAFT_680108 [Lasiosphaeria ovina]|uniref:Uncharacterized protein n=1 Tax=Lasiosphaeria ovina TaxID=92902 RepID=A0AAE0K6U7_9PEZI|nr:hypothetical protein B0T24DRAFT_680108 [Lasiosphaeria ovina]